MQKHTGNALYILHYTHSTALINLYKKAQMVEDHTTIQPVATMNILFSYLVSRLQYYFQLRKTEEKKCLHEYGTCRYKLLYTHDN